MAVAAVRITLTFISWMLSEMMSYTLISSLGNQKIQLVGHSSGGLIAAYIESKYHCCERLVLEDSPLFASYGDHRFNTFNYVDLSTICHDFLNQDEEKDFVLYYFEHQYAWKFFPEKTERKCRTSLLRMHVNTERSILIKTSRLCSDLKQRLRHSEA